MGLVLAKMIVRAHKRQGFVGALVYGPRGIGKSSYALKILKEALMMKHLELSETDAYLEALKLMKFKIGELIGFLKEHTTTGNLAMVLAMDDAGANLSKFLWWTHPREIRYLQSMTDTIRSGLSSLILTAPSPKSILSFMRTSYDDFFVRITAESGDWRRKATGYQLFSLPSGKTFVHKRFEDRYSCHLPDRIYEKYSKMRKTYLVQAIAELEKILGSGAEAKAEAIGA